MGPWGLLGSTWIDFYVFNSFQLTELHSGKVVEFLIGFVNKGSQGFTLETLDASFRYPMDYSFHIQNFTTLTYSKLVKPKEQATLSYSFFVDESFAGRPFGLSINLGYRDMVRRIIHGQIKPRPRGPDEIFQVFLNAEKNVFLHIYTIHVIWKLFKPLYLFSKKKSFFFKSPSYVETNLELFSKFWKKKKN